MSVNPFRKMTEGIYFCMLGIFLIQQGVSPCICRVGGGDGISLNLFKRTRLNVLLYLKKRNRYAAFCCFSITTTDMLSEDALIGGTPSFFRFKTKSLNEFPFGKKKRKKLLILQYPNYFVKLNEQEASLSAASSVTCLLS